MVSVTYAVLSKSPQFMSNPQKNRCDFLTIFSMEREEYNVTSFTQRREHTLSRLIFQGMNPEYYTPIRMVHPQEVNLSLEDPRKSGWCQNMPLSYMGLFNLEKFSRLKHWTFCLPGEDILSPPKGHFEDSHLLKMFHVMIQRKELIWFL